MVGRKIFQYEIVEPLGTGRLGPVYRATHAELGRDVVIRRVPEIVTQDSARLQHALRDLKAAMALEHPNICRIFDIVKLDAEWFVALEFLSGESLPAWFFPYTHHVSVGPWGSNPPLRFTEYFGLVRDILGAIEAAHRRGVAHGGLKPANMMMPYRGEFKIMDFGFSGIRQAVLAEGGSGREASADRQRLRGWAAYQSPEQLQGGAGDERSDIFSLGAILYELATGLPPFAGKSSDAAVASLLNEKPREPLDQTPSLPAPLGHIISKALEKDPGARYPKVTELRRDIEAVFEEASDWRRGPIVG
jgi:serine/threonine protein kinase